MLNKFNDEIYNNLTDYFDTIKEISCDDTGKIYLVNSQDKELNFDIKYVPSNFTIEERLGKMLVDTILPRKNALYLVEFKNTKQDKLAKRPLNRDLPQKLTNSLLLIKNKYNCSIDESKIQYFVFFGKKETNDDSNDFTPLSEIVEIDEVILKKTCHNITNKTNIFSMARHYTEFENWYNLLEKIN